MMRHGLTLLAAAGAILMVAGAATAGQAKPAAPPPAAAAPAAAPGKLVPPVRGVADLAVLKPVVKNGKIDGRDYILTSIQVKNMSTGSIAGLKVDEFWYDKTGNPVTGDTFRYRKPLQPGEVITVELRTPRDPRMNRNQYLFAHANGDVKATAVPKF